MPPEPTEVQQRSITDWKELVEHVCGPDANTRAHTHGDGTYHARVLSDPGLLEQLGMNEVFICPDGVTRLRDGAIAQVVKPDDDPLSMDDVMRKLQGEAFDLVDSMFNRLSGAIIKSATQSMQHDNGRNSVWSDHERLGLQPDMLSDFVAAVETRNFGESFASSSPATVFSIGWMRGVSVALLALETLLERPMSEFNAKPMPAAGDDA